MFSDNGMRCCKYNFNLKKWRVIARMNNSRLHGSSTVFKGKIVVSGGIRKIGGNFEPVKSVEAYGHHQNKWTCLPDMIEGRVCHSLVSIGNKLFVTAGQRNTISEATALYRSSWEAFDSITRKFTLIRHKVAIINSDVSKYSACGYGNNVVLLNVCFNNIYQIVLYDTKNYALSLKRN